MRLRKAKPHEYMVQVPCILSSNIDNRGANEPASLKEAISRHYWPEKKMAMEREYNLLIKNGTWEVISLPQRANIIMGK